MIISSLFLSTASVEIQRATIASSQCILNRLVIDPFFNCEHYPHHWPLTLGNSSSRQRGKRPRLAHQRADYMPIGYRARSPISRDGNE
jgi:hypothetical protein